MAKKMLSVLLIICVCVGFASCQNEENEYHAKLYFLNQSGVRLEAEERILESEDNETLMANKIISELVKGPNNAELIRSVPKETAVKKIDLNNDVLYVDFNEKFKFDNEADRILACAAIVSSVTTLTGVQRVKFTVEGEPLKASDGTEVKTLSKEDIVYDSQLVVADYKYVKLYFADKDGDKLVPEGRTVTVNSKESTEYVLVNELIKGPNSSDVLPTIPEGTKVLSVETKEGVCFVNLSKEFKSRHSGGSAGETMTIYSIVNTLTELDNVKKVQFLIEGQKEEVFIHYIFNEPFERKESLI